MFQTEPILALQKLEWLRFPMWLLSELGLTPVFIVILLAITYMVDFRKGFVLVQIVSWNGIFTDLFKAFFALPRPDAVDSRVLLGGVADNPVGFEGKGAIGFFDPLPADVVSHYRRLEDVAHGFPSGHCSATTSAWGGIAMLFKRWDVRIVSLCLIAFMPLSRMYLGRHFLADVLGGIVQGSLVVAIGWFACARGLEGRPALFDRVRTAGPTLRLPLEAIYFFVLPLAVMILPHADIDECARLVGINLGWLLIRRRGLPVPGGSAVHRLARFGLALATFILVAMVTSLIVGSLALPSSELSESATSFAAALATLWGATELALKLGWFPGRETRRKS